MLHSSMGMSLQGAHTWCRSGDQTAVCQQGLAWWWGRGTWCGLWCSGCPQTHHTDASLPGIFSQWYLYTRSNMRCTYVCVCVHVTQLFLHASRLHHLQLFEYHTASHMTCFKQHNWSEVMWPELSPNQSHYNQSTNMQCSCPSSPAVQYQQHWCRTGGCYLCQSWMGGHERPTNMRSTLHVSACKENHTLGVAWHGLLFFISSSQNISSESSSIPL